MGLLYQIPVEQDPSDERVEVKEGQITLKSYGLPMIFWGYLAAILAVIFFMYLAIHHPIDKIIQTNDPLNILLGRSVQLTLFGIPITLLGFFFYEKHLLKSGHKLSIIHKIFWLTIYKKEIELIDESALSVDHFMDSPNMAKIQNKREYSGFQNRGYFQLFAMDKNNKVHLIDRNSRKGEIKKLKELLELF